MPSNTNLKEEEIVDALGKDGNASMSEQVKRPDPWKKMMMMMMMMGWMTLPKYLRLSTERKIVKMHFA